MRKNTTDRPMSENHPRMSFWGGNTHHRTANRSRAGDFSIGMSVGSHLFDHGATIIIAIWSSEEFPARSVARALSA